MNIVSGSSKNTGKEINDTVSSTPGQDYMERKNKRDHFQYSSSNKKQRCDSNPRPCVPTGAFQRHEKSRSSIGFVRARMINNENLEPPLTNQPISNVMLVSTDIEGTSVVYPEKKIEINDESYSGSDVSASMTLELLRNSMSSYTKTIYYNDGKNSHTKNRLEIYCCKLPQNKKYSFYKRVEIVERQEERNTPKQFLEGSCVALYETFDLINRYVKCFATLAEFTFEFSVSSPWEQYKGSGLSNVLVVDKVWIYNHEKKLYIPSYKPMECGDHYTDYVVSSLKNFYGCDRIEFISTLHTALFANSNVLEKTSRPPLHQNVSNQPLKKRIKVVSSSTDQQVSDSQSTEEVQQPKVSNPTLIIFKQNFKSQERVLVCPISIEIHLSGEVKYNY